MSTALTRLLGVFCLAVSGLLLLASETYAQRGLDLENDTLTQSVLIHPPIDASEDGVSLTSSEHTYQPVFRLGDQLGRDFSVEKRGEDGIYRPYKPGTDGEENEDWFGWREEVLAPFDGRVVGVVQPDTVNVPGELNTDAQPGLILFKNSEEINVVYAHAREIEVEKGESVSAGEVVAKVGNNATSRSPHIHIGAWKGKTSLLFSEKGGIPLQIQVDLYAEQRFGED
jgi:hypothetical protein